MATRAKAAKPANTQTFEEAVAEFKERSMKLLGKETSESGPPGLPSPYEQKGPPYESPVRLDPRTIQNYVRGIGDSNPLFMDPDYGKHTRYGTQIAPGPMLSVTRGITAHGVQAGKEAAKRPGGYPLANFYSGTAWEFYDVLRVGDKFTTSMVTKEIFEKKGSQGDLVFFISELLYWNYHGDLPGKCYGTLIMVPIPTMGTSRSMPVDKLGEHMMYTRGSTKYTAEQIEKILDDMDNVKRRGADTLYWEDVQIGDKLGPVIVPPWTLWDYGAPRTVTECTSAAAGAGGDTLAFEPAFAEMRAGKGGYGNAFTNPVTRWPWQGNVEHEDALFAAYRAQPGPFDGGGQRVQIPQQLFTNWGGDDAFIRRLQSAIRRPVYYSDCTYYTGEVVKKFTEVQKGDSKKGGAPGKAEYHVIGIKWQGVNQVGQTHTQGTAAVYLPSRQYGPVQLPIPHPGKPPFVPYETFYRDWF